MRKPSPLALAASLLLVAAPIARANFHFWDIQEIYSNADGSIQFIEFFTASGGQEVLGTHTLASTGATTFTFPSNLPVGQAHPGGGTYPASTAGQTFLVGTSNLGTLFGVTPDYIISANFLSTGAGRLVNFSGGTDVVNLDNSGANSPLPTDGVRSLNGVTSNATATVSTLNAQATPTNFFGSTATIPEPTSVALIASGLLLGAARRRRARA